MNIILVAESSILHELVRQKKELKIAFIHFLIDLSYTLSARFTATWLLLTTANLHL